MADRFETELVASLSSLRRYARSLAGGEKADDLVQTTIEKALSSRNSYDSTQPLVPWLFRIMRNAWLDAMRRQRTRGIEADIDDNHDAAVIEGERTVEASLMLRRTAEAMESLPHEQRELLLLVCVEEMTYAQAAELLSIPIGTVMSRLARARLALAERLGIK